MFLFHCQMVGRISKTSSLSANIMEDACSLLFCFKLSSIIPPNCFANDSCRVVCLLQLHFPLPCYEFANYEFLNSFPSSQIVPRLSRVVLRLPHVVSHFSQYFHLHFSHIILRFSLITVGWPKRHFQFVTSIIVIWIFLFSIVLRLLETLFWILVYLCNYFFSNLLGGCTLFLFCIVFRQLIFLLCVVLRIPETLFWIYLFLYFELPRISFLILVLPFRHHLCVFVSSG